jgi:hypothetical protein
LQTSGAYCGDNGGPGRQRKPVAGRRTTVEALRNRSRVLLRRCHMSIAVLDVCLHRPSSSPR